MRFIFLLSKTSQAFAIRPLRALRTRNGGPEQEKQQGPVQRTQLASTVAVADGPVQYEEEPALRGPPRQRRAVTLAPGNQDRALASAP